MDLNIPTEAIASYFDYLVSKEILSFVISLIGLVIVYSFFKSLINLDKKRKTKEYREDLTNLYVAGKVKQIADKDGVNLDKEVKEFRKFEKLINCKDKDLDSVLEEEMKEKIQEDFEKAKNKK